MLMLLQTAMFIAVWSFIHRHVAANGPITYARVLTKINNCLCSAGSLIFLLLLAFSSIDDTTRKIYHTSKFYEYLDILGVCAIGGEIDLHFATHHLTTPYLTLTRVIWYSQGWKVLAALNAFHHVLIYAFFGGAAWLRPALPVTGTVQLVVGLVGEILILLGRWEQGTGPIWPHVFGLGLLSTYFVLWLRDLQIRASQPSQGDKRRS